MAEPDYSALAAAEADLAARASAGAAEPDTSEPDRQTLRLIAEDSDRMAEILTACVDAPPRVRRQLLRKLKKLAGRARSRPLPHVPSDLGGV